MGNGQPFYWLKVKQNGHWATILLTETGHLLKGYLPVALLPTGYLPTGHLPNGDFKDVWIHSLTRFLTKSGYFHFSLLSHHLFPYLVAFSHLSKRESVHPFVRQNVTRELEFLRFSFFGHRYHKARPFQGQFKDRETYLMSKFFLTCSLRGGGDSYRFSRQRRMTKTTT